MGKNGVARDIPPPLELECLKALWDLGEGNVKDVRQSLLHHKKLAYTTVMTVLDRLVRRGGVERRKVGRAFVYTPSVDRETLRRLALKQFVDVYFGGSEEALRAYLGAANRPTAEASAEVDLDTSLL
jgi:predicted transcriptional regulator